MRACRFFMLTLMVAGCGSSSGGGGGADLSPNGTGGNGEAADMSKAPADLSATTDLSAPTGDDLAVGSDMTTKPTPGLDMTLG
ncbi:MAG TPA: hypothetical protein VIA18_24300, partial [Polyangia bacterium]|nr:hypothetical protein [Polyangia bacterium]